MNTGPSYFFRRYLKQIQEGAIIIAVVGFGAAYNKFAGLRSIVDIGLNPAVAGISVLYGKVSTEIYKLTGKNLGFVTLPPDQDFLFSVRLATYINQRRAAPLLDIAVDSRLPVDRRERALMAILKFETTSDWIQPFLNELPKGGLLGMYDDHAPLLDELMKKIRLEGGVRQALVRAYAEVVFSFMLQVPDLVVRKHAAKWLSDVVAEDAVFLLIPRFEKEQDPTGRVAIENALFNVRAISEPETARELLLPYYRNPTWPGLRLPLAVILARLGHSGALGHVNAALKSESLTNEQRLILSLASSRTPYPRQLKISDKEQTLLAQRQKAREEDARIAMDRQRQIQQQERTRRALIARAEYEKAFADAKAQAAATAKAAEEAAAAAKVAKEKAAQERAEQERVALAQAAKERELALERERIAKEQAAKVESKKPAKEDKKVVAVPPPPPPVPKQEPVAERVPPKQILPIPGALSNEEIAAQKAAAAAKAAAEQLAMLPPPEETFLPPALEGPTPKAKSLMNYVDMIFEVKKGPVPLYQNPGDSSTGVVLPVGTKGKAEFEVLIGEDHWFQVKSKKGNGWANGKLLNLFNLSPMGNLPSVEAPQETSMDAGRKESTYFEASVENVPIFEKATEKAKQVGILSEDVAYLAVRSEKVGADRWFLLQLRAGETGWVRGLDLRLADVQQPVSLTIPSKPLSQRDKKSMFAAEWVAAVVKGVGVYSRASIVSKMVTTIDPSKTYKVVETSAGGGKEWYKIELGNNQEGWVQTMDVSLKKGPE